MERSYRHPTAVVILNWNGEGLLKRFLPRVVANTDGADIIIADNASADNSVEWVREHFPSVRILTFDTNYGYAEGYNKAVGMLDSYSNFVLLNSDAAPAPGWIKPLEESLAQTDVVAAQPKLLSETDHTMFEYAGAAGGFLDRNGYPYCRGRILGTIEADKGQYDVPSEIFWASGAALAVKRGAYLAAGGLDPLFFAHMEEIDLCWRMKILGGKIVYQPDSVVYHLGGGSLDSLSPKKTYLNFRNNLLMLYKDLPQNKRKKALLLRRRLLDTIAWGKFIMTGKFQHAAAIRKAHNDFRKMKKSYTDFPDIDLFTENCTRNILTDYYLRRKKTF